MSARHGPESSLRRHSGACKIWQSIDYSGLRRAATGILGGSFPTPLYRLRPVGVPSRRIPDFLSINDGGGVGEQGFSRS